jgi:hypothetical protein
MNETTDDSGFISFSVPQVFKELTVKNLTSGFRLIVFLSWGDLTTGEREEQMGGCAWDRTMDLVLIRNALYH